jgi:prepilin-type N-terminal cleavage/methylation domain-containing protein
MNKNQTAARRTYGFTIVEVIVALTIMSLMMVGLLSYVHSGSVLWKKGQTTLNVRNYYRSVVESIEHDMNIALNVNIPVGAVQTSLLYEIPIRQGANSGIGKIKLEKTGNVLMRKLVNASGFIITDAATNDEAQLYRPRFEYVLARDVATFTAKRISSFSIDINLGLQSLASDDNAQLNEDDNTQNHEATRNATMTFIITSGK